MVSTLLYIKLKLIILFDFYNEIFATDNIKIETKGKTLFNVLRVLTTEAMRMWTRRGTMRSGSSTYAEQTADAQRKALGMRSECG